MNAPSLDLNHYFQVYGVNPGRFPKLPKGKKRCLFGNSKWHNAEEETIIELIVNYAIEQGEWSVISLEELKRRARENIVFGSHNFHRFQFSLDNVALTGDVRVEKTSGGIEVVIPLEEFAKTISSSTLNFL